jgi:hypothetical protein
MASIALCLEMELPCAASRAKLIYVAIGKRGNGRGLAEMRENEESERGGTLVVLSSKSQDHLCYPPGVASCLCFPSVGDSSSFLRGQTTQHVWEERGVAVADSNEYREGGLSIMLWQNRPN